MTLSEKIIIFLLLPLLLCVFLLHYMVVGQGVYGDGIFYYAYTRSLYKDHDINFANELGHHYSPENNNSLRDKHATVNTDKTATGLIVNRYPPGAGLAWIPAFALADIGTNVASIFGIQLPTLGYSNIYQITVGLLNIIFVIIGLYILHSFLIYYFSNKIAMLSVVTILVGSNFFYYSSIDVINSHPFSFLLATLTIVLFWRTYKKRHVRQWFFLGFLIGLLALTRSQDIVFLLLPMGEIGSWVIKRNWKNKIRQLKNIFIFGIGLLIPLSLQSYIWNVLYNNPWSNPYVGKNDGINILQPHILEVILNEKTGIIPITPIFFIAFIGLLFLRKKYKTLSLYALALVVTEFYIISSWSGWHQGASFGTRMLISSIPFLSLGLAETLKRLEQKSKILPYVVCVFFIVINISLIFKFLLYDKEPSYIAGEDTHAESVTKFKSLFKIFK